MTATKDQQIPGVGPTTELSLRVSIATLARVVFDNPETRESQLALEHKATLLTGKGETRVVVKAQPFGGAVRILNTTRLQNLVGDFQFDSARSHSEGDLRIYIRPSDWGTVREFCLSDLTRVVDPDLEAHPGRELAEEFMDTLGVGLKPDQYTVIAAGVVVEDEPACTDNIYASRIPTVRIYRIFEAQIHDLALCRAMVSSSEAHSSQVLRSMAFADAQQGGQGRANGILVAPIGRVRAAYLALPPERRSAPIPFENTLLAGNVPAVLENIPVPKYRYITG